MLEIGKWIARRERVTQLRNTILTRAAELTGWISPNLYSGFNEREVMADGQPSGFWICCDNSDPNHTDYWVNVSTEKGSPGQNFIGPMAIVEINKKGRVTEIRNMPRLFKGYEYFLHNDSFDNRGRHYDSSGHYIDEKIAQRLIELGMKPAGYDRAPEKINLDKAGLCLLNLMTSRSRDLGQYLEAVNRAKI